MANIYDIAREAGVSRSTVSRVINDQPSVSADKKRRVLKAIEKLKYTPSATARALATNKTHTIGVVSRALAQSFYDEFITSIHLGADALGYGVIYTIRHASMNTNIHFSQLMHKKVDGYIFLGEETTTEEELKDMADQGLPAVGYEFSYDLDKVSFININNEESAYKAMVYIRGLGHVNTIHLTYERELQEMKHREDGYFRAVQALDMGVSKVFHVPFIPESIYKSCQQMIPYIRHNHVTAAFCANNTIATYFIEVLIANGYRVPEDFSVIGFDDTPVERPLTIKRQQIPDITSIRQPQKAMGQFGIEQLIRTIEGDGAMPAGNRIFDCEMIIRDTTVHKK